MCLLIALFKVVPSAPLIVAANRDEQYDRPAVAITTLRKAGPRMLGGRDEVAGGTWMAVNEYGVVAGLTNLPSPQGRDPAKRSRGELPVALAAHQDAAAAVAWICATVNPADYNPCWLMVGDRQSLFYVDLTGGNRPVARDLPAGTYVLENAPLLPESAKAGHVAGLIKAALAAGNGDVRGALATVLCDHSPGPAASRQDAGRPAASRQDARPQDASPADASLQEAGPDDAGLDDASLQDASLHDAGPDDAGTDDASPNGDLSAACVHADGYGTRSAMIVTVGAAGRPAVQVADGPSCQAPLLDVGELWAG